MKYRLENAFCDGITLLAETGRKARLMRSEIEKLELEKVHEIIIILK